MKQNSSVLLETFQVRVSALSEKNIANKNLQEMFIYREYVET